MAALALQTPVIQAAMGFMGTLVTGFLASLVIAIFVRKRTQEALNVIRG